MKLTKTHPLFVKNTVSVLLLVEEVAAASHKNILEYLKIVSYLLYLVAPPHISRCSAFKGVEEVKKWMWCFPKMENLICSVVIEILLLCIIGAALISFLLRGDLTLRVYSVPNITQPNLPWSYKQTKIKITLHP